MGKKLISTMSASPMLMAQNASHNAVLMRESEGYSLLTARKCT